MSSEDGCVILVCAVILIGFAGLVSALPEPGPTESNYNRITNGMSVAEVSEILGNGEIYCSDNWGMVSMRYVGKGVKIYVTFIDGIVYKMTIKQGEALTNGEYLYPETEL